jgi:uncharacterized protein with HEPN domain
MPSEQSRQWLIDIRDNARLAQSFIAGRTYTEFQADRQLFYAVTRCLEIISEASRWLDDEMRQRHPELPWRDIASAGNIFRHVYRDVRADEV